MDQADRVAPFRPKPGAIVPPIEFERLAYAIVSRAERLGLVPLEHRLRYAVRWRVRNLGPIAASSAYAELWNSPIPDRRTAMIEAIFKSGDYHYGGAKRELRQTFARWIHARLAAAEALPDRLGLVARDERGALM